MLPSDPHMRTKKKNINKCKKRERKFPTQWISVKHDLGFEVIKIKKKLMRKNR